MHVLSAGAIQRGLETAAAAFEKQTGHKLSITFATAPVIRDKLADGASAPDVVIAPLEAMRDFEQQRVIARGSSTVIGSVKAGVVVRQGAPPPDISSAGALKKALTSCDAIVYTQGSSGIFVEELIRRLGISEAVKPKLAQLPDAAAVMKRLAAGNTAREIGFGQVTAILFHAHDGVTLVGPLPEEIENITTYAAGIGARAETPEPAQRFLEFLISPSSKAGFAAMGVQ